MEEEVRNFIDNIDSWIKQIRSEVSDVSCVKKVIEENIDNTQHNYELIHELREQVEDLKKEINALKLIQLVSLRGNLKRN